MVHGARSVCLVSGDRAVCRACAAFMGRATTHCSATDFARARLSGLALSAASARRDSILRHAGRVPRIAVPMVTARTAWREAVRAFAIRVGLEPHARFALRFIGDPLALLALLVRMAYALRRFLELVSAFVRRDGTACCATSVRRVTGVLLVRLVCVRTAASATILCLERALVRVWTTSMAPFATTVCSGFMGSIAKAFAVRQKRATRPLVPATTESLVLGAVFVWAILMR